MTNNSTRPLLKQKMVSTPGVFTDNSPISPSQYISVKVLSSIKSLRHFLDTFKVKPNTAVRRFCSAESKRKAIRSDIMLWYSLPKRQGHSKINQ